MPSNVRLLPDAQRDLERFAQWYEEQGRGLGNQMILAVEDCLTLIGDNPGSFQEVIPNIRRVLTKRFPYAIYFRPEPDRVVVLAILHCSRSPRAWKHRVRRKT